MVEEAIEHMAVKHCADLNSSVSAVGRMSRQFDEAKMRVGNLRRQVRDVKDSLKMGDLGSSSGGGRGGGGGMDGNGHVMGSGGVSTDLVVLSSAFLCIVGNGGGGFTWVSRERERSTVFMFASRSTSYPMSFSINCIACLVSQSQRTIQYQ